MIPPLFPTNQWNDSMKSIDLHGHSVQKAKEALTDLFSQAEKEHLSHVHIITGKGHHSKGGYGVLFNDTVPKFLKSPEIQCRIEGFRKDMGGYIVELKRDVSYHQNLEKLYQFSQQFFSTLILPTHSFQITLESAEKDNREDQFRLYSYYLTGSGIGKDIEKALIWLEKAANNGHQIAQSTLGFEYVVGKHVEKNYKKAMFWHKRAVSEEHKEPNLDSLFWIGSCYWLGTGVIRNDEEAINHLTKAADKDHQHAAFNLGRIFTEGCESIPIDAKKGCYYLSIAAKAGIVDAQVRLAKHLFFGWGGIEVDYRKALHWFSEADRLGKDPIAQYYIGRIHYEAKGVSKSVKLANEAFQKSAAQGDKDAENSTAWILIMETKTTKSIELGMSKLKKLSEQRHRQSAYMLGALFVDQREIIKKDVDQAIYYLTIAAELGEVDACRTLADIYLKEKNNLNEAIKWQREAVNLEEHGLTLFRLVLFLLQSSKKFSQEQLDEIVDFLSRAAALKFVPAQEMLSDFYFDGSAVPQNIEKGIALLKEAAQNGSSKAKLKLGQIYLRKETPEDQKIGLSYLAGASKEQPEALFGLALCYRDGIGCTKDESKFRSCLEKAAKEMHPEAVFMLGKLHFVEKKPQAFEDFKLAIKLGIARAELNIALCYTEGVGVQKNIQYAMEIYVKLTNSPQIEIAQVAEYCLALTYFGRDSARQSTQNINHAIYWLKRSLKHGYTPSISLFPDWIDVVSSSQEGFDDFLNFLYKIAKEKEKSEIRDHCRQLLQEYAKIKEENLSEEEESEEDNEMPSLEPFETVENVSSTIVNEQPLQSNSSYISEKCAIM